MFRYSVWQREYQQEGVRGRFAVTAASKRMEILLSSVRLKLRKQQQTFCFHLREWKTMKILIFFLYEVCNVSRLYLQVCI